MDKYKIGYMFVFKELVGRISAIEAYNDTTLLFRYDKLSKGTDHGNYNWFVEDSVIYDEAIIINSDLAKVLYA